MSETGLGEDSKSVVLAFTKPSGGLLAAPLHNILHVKVSERKSKKSQFLFVPVLSFPLSF